MAKNVYGYCKLYPLSCGFELCLSSGAKELSSRYRDASHAHDEARILATLGELGWLPVTKYDASEGWTDWILFMYEASDSTELQNAFAELESAIQALKAKT